MPKKQFAPYQIRHLSLTATSGRPVPSGNALCYIWWRDIPLGHVWIENERPSLQEFRQRVAEQVNSTVELYLGTNEKDWKSFFLNGDEAKLEDFFATHLLPLQLDSKTKNNEPISVVICTRNRSEFIGKCIQSIMDGTDKNFELVVVDNAPDNDLTKEVVLAFPGVRYILEPRKGLDIARNTGARNASYSIIAYTDDDVIIERNWVRKIKQCFKNPMVMSVTGQVIPVELKTRPQYVFEKYWGFNKGYRPLVFDHDYFTRFVDYGVPVWDIGAGANMAFRKAAFDLVGMFDERLDVGAAGCSGDSEFWYRILAEGWNCFYCPQLYVYHNHRETEKSLNNQVFNYMRGQVASLFVQHENYDHKGNLDRIYKALPEYYFRRFLRRFRTGFTEDYSTIFTEIKGYFSGIRFYRSVSSKKRKDVPVHNGKLYSDANVNEHTLVSVIITCYNYGRYLAQAIDSVYAQTYKNIEVVVVNDGSTDNTIEVLKNYPGTKQVRTQRVGLSAARNIGVQYSSGNYLMFLDADDYLYPNAVELNLYYFTYFPQVGFVSGGHDRVTEENDILPDDGADKQSVCDYPSLLKGNYIGMEATVMYRRELFFSFHFDTSLPACEDYDLNLRISRLFPIYSHDKKIAGYRMHDGNMSANKNMMLETVLKVLHSQEADPLNDEEKNALDQGVKNWTDYYTTREQPTYGR
jgi:glycosyltransferase involved in cell wall biosynthesis